MKVAGLVRVFGTGLAAVALGAGALAQTDKPEHHSRRYKPLQPAVRLTVHVEKAANGKPVENAAVIFRATKNGKNEGSLEIKSDPDGKAMLDVIEVGSHVKVQVIADGFSTAATEFDVPDEVKEVTVRMEKPRAQVSSYDDGQDRPSARPAGVQEPRPVVKQPNAVRPMPVTKPVPTQVPPIITPPTPETAPPGTAPKEGSASGSSAGTSSTVTPGAATVGAPK